MTIAEIIKQRTELNIEYAERQRAHEAYVSSVKTKLAQLREDEALAAAGVDIDRMRRGLGIVEVYGKHSAAVVGGCSENQRSYGDRLSVVESAKVDVANGAPRLLKEYFGVKNYAHFGDQREDHSYLYGPKHGTIVFSIGLTRAFRQRLETEAMTPAEIEDALYVLINLEHLDAARALRCSAS